MVRDHIAVALALLLFFFPLSLKAAESPDKSPPKEEAPSVGGDFGYGVTSVLSTIFYTPAKITYAGLGLMTGGLGYVLSGGNADVATHIIYPAVKGDYVVTPRHLKGEEPLVFVGAPPAPEPQQTEQPSAPQSRLKPLMSGPEVSVP